MRPWTWVIAIAVVLAIIFLIGSGSDDRTFAARARSEVNARPWQETKGSVAVVGPEQTLILVGDAELLPEDAAAALDEARERLADAANQEADQQRESLEEANDRVDDAIDSVEDAADDTDNLAHRVRLEQLLVTLKAVQARIELQIELLEAVS